jgi:hypothetical protein
VGVEKVRQQKRCFAWECVGRVLLFSVWLRGSWQNRRGWVAEKAHESLDVLSRRCQEELLPHKLQSAQAQATQSDLILEFREQGFYFFPLPLCLRKLWRVGQFACPLPNRLMHVNGKTAEGCARALRS